MHPYETGHFAADSASALGGGYTSFYVVPDSGAGLWTGEIINLLRNNDPALLLQCILPHEEIASKWSPELRDRYFALLEQCTHLSAVSRPGHGDAMGLALAKLIDASDFVIAVYAPESRRGDAVDRAMEYLQETGSRICGFIRIRWN